MKKLVEVKKLQRIRALRKLRFHSKRIVEMLRFFTINYNIGDKGKT